MAKDNTSQNKPADDKPAGATAGTSEKSNETPKPPAAKENQTDPAKDSDPPAASDEDPPAKDDPADKPTGPQPDKTGQPTGQATGQQPDKPASNDLAGAQPPEKSEVDQLREDLAVVMSLAEDQAKALTETKAEMAQLQQQLGEGGGTSKSAVVLRPLADEVGEIPPEKQKYVRQFAVTFTGVESANYLQPIEVEAFDGQHAWRRICRQLKIDPVSHRPVTKCITPAWTAKVQDGASAVVHANSEEHAKEMIESIQGFVPDRVTKTTG